MDGQSLLQIAKRSYKPKSWVSVADKSVCHVVHAAMWILAWPAANNRAGGDASTDGSRPDRNIEGCFNQGPMNSTSERTPFGKRITVTHPNGLVVRTRHAKRVSCPSCSDSRVTSRIGWHSPFLRDACRQGPEPSGIEQASRPCISILVGSS